MERKAGHKPKIGNIAHENYLIFECEKCKLITSLYCLLHLTLSPPFLHNSLLGNLFQPFTDIDKKNYSPRLNNVIWRSSTWSLGQWCCQILASTQTNRGLDLRSNISHNASGKLKFFLVENKNCVHLQVGGATDQTKFMRQESCFRQVTSNLSGEKITEPSRSISFSSRFDLMRFLSLKTRSLLQTRSVVVSLPPFSLVFPRNTGRYIQFNLI